PACRLHCDRRWRNQTCSKRTYPTGICEFSSPSNTSHGIVTATPPDETCHLVLAEKRRLMLSHACPSTVLADAQWPALERLVQLVDVIRNIGRTASVPPEIYVVSDYIGPTSKCHAIDSAASCEGGEPTRILGPG